MDVDLLIVGIYSLVVKVYRLIIVFVLDTYRFIDTCEVVDIYREYLIFVTLYVS